MSKTTVAAFIVSTLIKSGIKRVYGVAGDSLNGITDAIRQSGEITWVPVRHEEVAAFAAGAEAHLTDSIAVCAGSCGPGNLHLINGLYDCHRSRVPVLAIAAHIPSHEIGSSYFQETHPERLFLDCSHYCEFISSVTQMPRTFEAAMQHAITKRGVAVIVLPGDIALQSMPDIEPRIPALNAHSALRPGLDSLQSAAALLNAGKRVCILGGAGCRTAHAALMRVAERLAAPIVHAMRGKEYIEYDNPNDVGMTGLLGFSSGYKAMMDCDVLLMLGTDFPYEQFYPQNAKIIQVDTRGENIGRRARVDVGVVGDVNETLAALDTLLTAHTDRTYLDKCLKDYRQARQSLNDLATGKPGSAVIHPQHVAALTNTLAADDAIFTCDVGTPTIWASRYLSMNGKRRLVGSFSHGSMANALPQAIGAQLTYPTRQVISLSGDGGFAMLMGDFLTLAQLKLPIKVIVFNNSALGFVELEMKANGILNFATDLTNPNFAQVAEAVGIRGWRVDDAGALEGALKAALAHPGPALIDVAVNRMELAMPPHLEAQQALGFSLFMMKAVFSGRGDEIVELTKSNLFR